LTTVVKVKQKPPNFTLYIGRAWAGLPESKWHNPFHLRDYSHDECIRRYEEYIRIHPELIASLHEIDDQILGCWCYETPSDGSVIKCHGDILIKLRKEQLEGIL
jgi:hypothetical protein